MTIKKKSIAQKPSEHLVEEFINSGGKSASEKDEASNKTEVRFTLRIPKEMVKEVDAQRKNRIGNISRNNWILEAIAGKMLPR